MNLIFYGYIGNGAIKKVQNAIKEVVSEKQIEHYHTIESFSIRLRQYSEQAPIALVLASNRQELLKIVAIQDLLFGISIILILPDATDQTISMGHKLHPRFLSYLDSDFKDVATVLTNMIEGRSNAK